MLEYIYVYNAYIYIPFDFQEDQNQFSGNCAPSLVPGILAHS